MPKDIIVFDSEYTSQQARNVGRAAQLIEETIRELNGARAHSGWKCKERLVIDNTLAQIVSDLNKIQGGLSDTSKALGAAKERFADLERRSSEQAQNLSGSNVGDSGYVSGNKRLPVTQVPDKPNARANKIGKFGRTIIIGLAGAVASIVGAIGMGVEGFVKGFGQDIKEKVVGVDDPTRSTIIEKEIEITTAPLAATKHAGILPYINAIPSIIDLGQSIGEASADNTWTTKETANVAGTFTDGLASVALGAICPPLSILSPDKALWKTVGGILEGKTLGASTAKHYTAFLLTMLDGEIEGTTPADFPIELFQDLMAGTCGVPVIDHTANTLGELMYGEV